MSSELTPEEALTIQHALTRWWKSPIGARFGETFARSIATQTTKGDAHTWGQLRNGHFVALEAESLDTAPTYLVLDEMCELVQHASHTWQPQTFRTVDIPSESGFVWFNKPFYTVDVHGKRLNNAAVHWHPIQMRRDMPPDNDLGAKWAESTGVWISYYSDALDPEDEMNPFLPPGARYLHRLSLLHGEALWLNDEAVTDNGITIPVEPTVTHGYIETHDKGPVVNPYKYMQAFWTLIRQRLAHTEVVQGEDRAARKRIERLGLSKPGEINVVNLRRVYEYNEKGGEDPATKWSHRWMVSGHWRNQWYPSIQEHRQVWIAPYEKGPEGADLVLKPKVFRWAK